MDTAEDSAGCVEKERRILKIRIAAVTHKPYVLPADPLYVPLMAGAADSSVSLSAFVRDDMGDNISEKNGTFSELTGLYWLWKNHDGYCPDADYLGLCHYRRYFAVRKGLKKKLLIEEDAEKLMAADRAVLPKHRNYVIETNYSHYIHSHHSADLDLAREIIAERHPDYTEAYDRRMAMTKGHRFNMFIMPAEMLDSYCEWLFDILFELESRLDICGYEGRDRRVFGLVAERLLDVWIDKNGIPYTELPYMMTEKERLLLKGVRMVGRKLRSMSKRRKNGRGGTL